MILHIPHASPVIPDKYSDQFVLAQRELDDELLRMTGHFTDELFDLPGAVKIIHPISRLVVDVERFADDSLDQSSI